MRPFRFGTNLRSVDDAASFARWAEDAGFDALLLPDHLGVRLSPFATLAAAAAATERLALGTYVLNVPFWNPAMLAREIVTLDALSGGRFELGVGAGHMRSEFELAGIPWEPFDVRCARVEAFLADLDGLLAQAAGSGDDDAERGLRARRPSVLVGASSDRLLRLAVRRADVVAHAGLRQVRGAKLGTFRMLSAEEYDERIAFTRAEATAADRAFDDLEHAVLLQHVKVTDDRQAALTRLADDFETPAELLATTPFVAVGSEQQIADQLLAARERYGFTYVTTHRPSAEALAKVIPLLRGAEA
ncbi:TIGR03621 family F420-dependent LLM class oxidoreductase [Xylanimonas sp. McL0601]|uniref:TIGR03621 family F420-dependent LLM class oxidoreductase n=1 Tax=Xylanimonas sp. McL0601 TaxID=3414739 RepID=UPI003CEF8CE4